MPIIAFGMNNYFEEFNVFMYGPVAAAVDLPVIYVRPLALREQHASQ